MIQKYNIVMTVGVYSVATGESKQAELQKTVIQTLSRQEHVMQVHGFLYNQQTGDVSVDVVADRSITNDQAFSDMLIDRLKSVLPDTPVNIVIDHNYSE